MAENPRESNGYMAKLYEGESVISARELATGGINGEALTEIIERIRATKGDLILSKRETDVINGMSGKLIIGGAWTMDFTTIKAIPENKPLELRLEIDGKTYRYDLIPKEGAEDE